MSETTPLLSPEANRVMILVNPKAGARSAQGRVDLLVELLRRQGLTPEVSSDLAEVTEKANRQSAEGRLRALVGVGGDGTAAELANRTQPGVPITLLPAGNENLLARYLGLGAAPEGLCQTIADGAIVRLDAGRANGRLFLLMVGCGFDAEVVHRTHQERRGHIRTRSYFKPILSSIRSYEYPELLVHCWGEEDAAMDHQTQPLVVRWLFAFNLPCYGGGLRLAPWADGSDGLLDVCAFRHGRIWHGLRYAAAVLMGRHQTLSDCTVRRVGRLRVTSAAKVPYQLDGDPGGFLPLDIDILPGRLTVVVPRGGSA